MSNSRLTIASAFFIVASSAFSNAAQACTSTGACGPGYTVIDCSVSSCAPILVTPPGSSYCVVGSANDDNIFIIGGGGHLVCGNDGNDTIQLLNSTSGFNFIQGGAGDDNITGSALDDFIFGEGGADTINGGAGADFISGGADNDDLDGGFGDDTVNGDGGDDIVFGGNDQDTLSGGAGNDQLNGNSGIDSLSGNAGDDTLLSDANNDGDTYSGGDGDDRIFADGGANTINGGLGNDYVEGGAGNDTIIGGAGYDQLFGQDGNDDIQGNGDPDVLDGGAGTDNLDGGAALDTCVGANGGVVLGCENLTAARLLASVAYPHNGGTVIEWQTLFEAGTAGFELRVREGDQWQAVHRGLLAADVTGYAGAHYAYQLPNWNAQAEFEIREVDAAGVRRSLGIVRPTGLSQLPLKGLSAAHPFVSESVKVDRTWKLQPLDRTDRRLLNGAAGSAKLAVTSNGLQHVALASLAAELGVSVADLESRASAGELTVLLGDQPVVWSRTGDAITFVGEATDSPYSAERIYRVELQAGSLAARVDAAPQAGAGVLSNYTATAVSAEDTFAARVVPIDPSVDSWFSHALSPTTPGKADAALSLSLANYAGGDGLVRVELQGASSDPVAEHEHVFDVLVNGKHIGELEMAAFERETFELPVSSSALQAGDNEVIVRSTTRGSESSIAYLNRVEIDYERQFVAQDDAIAFVAQSNGNVEVAGFSAEQNLVVFEEDTKGVVRAVEGVEFEAENDAVRALFSVREGSRYWVSKASEMLAPWADSTVALRDLSSGADYVVIARADMLATAEALAAHRRDQGFSTLVVDVDDVYDNYAGGQPTPVAIRSFLEDAQQNWSTKPAYVVLAGASHFDYRDNLGFGTPLVPAYQVQLHNGVVSSDVPMVDFDDDGVPNIALGRLPAANDDELRVIVDKLIAYESLENPAWSKSVTLVGDRADDTTDFATDVEAFAEALPDNLSAKKLLRRDLDTDAMRTEVAATVKAGTAWLHYLGHGGLAQWSQGKGILSSADVDGWEARDAQPFVTAGTCLTGAYDFPGVRSLGEAWIGSEGGAIGVWGATASTIHSESDSYAQHLRKAIADDGRLRIGDAIVAASAAHAAQATEFGLDTRRAYAILGDPATVLHIDHPNPDVRFPEGEAVNVSREIRGTEATYDSGTINKPNGPVVVDDDGGCSLSGSLPQSAPWLLALVGVVLFGRRRRAS